MIIKNNRPQESSVPPFVWWLTGIAATIAAIFFVIPQKKAVPERTGNNISIFCGAENKIDSTNFLNNGIKFQNAHTQSDKEAFEGNYASLINAENIYSLSYKYIEFQPADLIESEIWVKADINTKVKLVAQGNEGSKFYKSTSEKLVQKNGWYLLTLKFKVPKNVSSITVYAYIISKEAEAYVDNLSITNRTLELNNKYPGILTDNILGLRFSLKAMDKLIDKRNKALGLGLLISEDDDWVKAKFKPVDAEELKVKARLKGDWTDHLVGDFWSFRIKLPADKTWNRLRTFSIQNPETRSHLREWVFHKFLEYEDILTPRYDFIKLKVNDNAPRIYAYEEHFEKQLVEFKNRREGVIIRYDESSYWDTRRRDKENDSDLAYLLESRAISQANVKPFGEAKIAANKKLLEQFNEANSLLTGFQKQTLEVPEVFDINRLAKFYAICEILKAHHASFWHNTRFYYNPIVKKLEPIGYDGFTETGAMVSHNNAFFGAYRTITKEMITGRSVSYLFRNKAFNTAYCKYLSAFSETAYIEKFIDSIIDELNIKQTLLNENDSSYFYNVLPVYKQAKIIKSALEVASNISMDAYKARTAGDSIEIKLTNNHPLPLDFIGSSEKRNTFTPRQETTIVYSNAKHSAKEYLSVVVPRTHKYIHYRLAGSTSSYNSPIKPWTTPQLNRKGNQNGSHLIIPLPEEAYVHNKDLITIKTGNYVISDPILIPYNKTIIIEPGTTIDLTKGAYFLSYSPVHLQGESANPITITSSDKLNQGFHILEAKSKSTLHNVEFTQLNTLSEGSWQLTGAVTFYESPVELDRVTISHNLCEDALNTIRTDFKATDLHINNTYADGFDSDFCKGSLHQCMFVNTGNDAIDFSGSQVTGDQLVMENIGDKGISAGEQASLSFKNITVTGAVIAVASKDLSIVKINNISISDCNKGFAAYQKKPEFGPATIKVYGYTAEAIEFLEIAEHNSLIELSQAAVQ